MEIVNRGVQQQMVASERQDWNTPGEVLRIVRAFDCIGLDPCSNAGSIVGAQTEWRLERDGDSLARDWRGYGLVYCNPPYSHHLRAWLAKCSTAHAEIIALTPARTDTVWWQDYAATADAICYWRGRLKFLGADNCAPFPSASCYWGPRVARFVEMFKPVGLVQVSANLLRHVEESPQMQLAL